MTPRIKSSHFLSFLVVLFILVSIPFSVSLVQKQQEIRKYAAPATTLYFSQDKTTVKIGETFILNGIINTGSNIVSAAEIHLAFDPVKLEMMSIDQGTFFTNPVILTPAAINNSQGTANITLGCEGVAPQQGTGNLFSLRFKALTSGEMVVSFDPATKVAANKEGSTSVLTGTAPVNVVITYKTDINNDSKVDILDYNAVVSDFNKSGPVGFSKADLDRNGRVDIFDFNLIIEDFGKFIKNE